MATPADRDSFLQVVRKSKLVGETVLAGFVNASVSPDLIAQELVRQKHLTAFQARLLLEGKHKGFQLGQYRILRPIGKGGLGLVYLAEHVNLPRKVAIKILRTDRSASKGVRERFEREGRTSAALDHPNIVRVFDVGEDGQTRYMVMEHLEGMSLEMLLQRRGRLPISEAIRYTIQAASGLQHAHEKGVVHRDINPANLFIDREGTLKILDMGLARFYDDSSDNLTERVGGLLGSPDFIAPEQVENKVDPRTDIYSLGATLYMMLLGEPPFPTGDIPTKLASHKSRAVLPLCTRDPKIPHELSAVVLRMMAKHPVDRHSTPGEVIDALTPFADPAPLAPSAPVFTPAPEAFDDLECELQRELAMEHRPTRGKVKLMLVTFLAALIGGLGLALTVLFLRGRP